MNQGLNLSGKIWPGWSAIRSEVTTHLIKPGATKCWCMCWYGSFVLISQNRMNIQADKRADLDLQVSLLTEHEVTRLIHLVTAIAKKMDITEAHHPEIEKLSKDVQPGKVLDTKEAQKRDTPS